MPRLCLLLLLLPLSLAFPAIGDDDATDEKAEKDGSGDISDEYMRFSPADLSSGKGPIALLHPGDRPPPIADAENRAENSNHGPVVIPNIHDYLIPPEDDPFAFLQEGTNIMKSLSAKLNLSFSPQMIYTYQHTTKVKPGYRHGYSYIYANINGVMPLTAGEDDPHGHLVYNVQGNSGLGTPYKPFIGESVGSPYFINNVLTNGRMSLKKLWWRQEFFDERLTVNIGKLYYVNFFDLNAAAENPADQFLASQLTNNTSVPFPSYGFGAVGEWDFSDETFLRFGTMNALSSGVSTGFENLDQGKMFNIVQFNWMPRFPIGDEDRQGHYRGYVWYSNNDVSYENGGWGGGISFDQDLGGGFTGFLRWGWAEDGSSPATMCWSSGFTLNGIMGRQLDGIGVGFTFSDLSGSGLSGGEGWETLVEAFWRIQVTKTMQFGPDIQWFNSGQSGGVTDDWIWGLRCTWNF